MRTGSRGAYAAGEGGREGRDLSTAQAGFGPACSAQDDRELGFVAEDSFFCCRIIHYIAKPHLLRETSSTRINMSLAKVFGVGELAVASKWKPECVLRFHLRDGWAASTSCN